jgi:hypothetical protein
MQFSSLAASCLALTQHMLSHQCRCAARHVSLSLHLGRAIIVALKNAMFQRGQQAETSVIYGVDGSGICEEECDVYY